MFAKHRMESLFLQHPQASGTPALRSPVEAVSRFQLNNRIGFVDPLNSDAT